VGVRVVVESGNRCCYCCFSGSSSSNASGVVIGRRRRELYFFTFFFTWHVVGVIALNNPSYLQNILRRVLPEEDNRLSMM